MTKIGYAATTWDMRASLQALHTAKHMTFESIKKKYGNNFNITYEGYEPVPIPFGGFGDMQIVMGYKVIFEYEV